MNSDFKIIPAYTINKIVQKHYKEMLDIIKNTYLLHESKKTINPNSYLLKFPDNPKARIIALPAAICDDNEISGIKWVASYPDNPKKYNIPRASALIVLNDYQTGFPIACLEGSIISALRTVFSAILAAEYLTCTKEIHTLGIIGNGFIAKNLITSMLKYDWVINNILLYDLDNVSSEKLQKHTNKMFNGTVSIVRSYEDVIKNSQIIVFTTTASKPYIDNVQLFTHNPIILHLSLRDLAPIVLINSDNVVDDIDHVLSAATSPELTFKEYNTKNFIAGTIGQLINNDIKVSEDKPIIYSPMGMGILDIAIARFILNHLQHSDYIKINDFFPGVD